MRNEYEERLRRIALNSADAIQSQVSAYLLELAAHGDWDARKQVLTEYRSLVDHLPKEYVDCVLNCLIVRPNERRDTERSVHKLGIKDFLSFFPPAHIQGPFLYTLRRNEEEGLRLVHSLANAAVATWCELQRRPSPFSPGRTPVPVVVGLRSGAREFWGTSQVYYWFRPVSNAPPAVNSALMALEAWMDEQLAAGSDPDELFERVLAGSSCAAVLGLCLGIALAHPDTCLRAALPIVSAPAIWKMDIARFASDQRRPVNVVRGFSVGRHEHIYKAIEEREKVRQRNLEVRSLAHQYMFLADESLRSAFQESVAKFTDNLPLSYEDERSNPRAVAKLREEMENFQIHGDPSNYRSRRTEEGYQVWLEAPEHIKARNDAILAPINEKRQWLGLSLWAQTTIERGLPFEGMTLEEAVSAAKGMQRADDFLTPYSVDPGLESARLQAIAGTAAAVLRTGFEWARERGLMSWCQDVLLAAACMPRRGDSLETRETIMPMDPKVSAAYGLSALFAHAASDADVEESLFNLAGEPYLQVVEAVFVGLSHSWSSNETICWNMLCLALSLCLPSRGLDPFQDAAEYSAEQARWAKGLKEQYLNLYQSNNIAGPPRIVVTSDLVFQWDLAARVLNQIPVAILIGNPAAKNRLLHIVDDLVAWTIDENTPDPGDRHSKHRPPPYQWNYFFLNWLAHLTRQLNIEESRRHVLDPIRNSWSVAPAVTAGLLRGYVLCHLSYKVAPNSASMEAWTEICHWVLGSPELASDMRRGYFINKTSDAVAAIVFVSHGECLLSDEWRHAHLFVGIIEAWVAAVGNNPDAFSYLLIMLERLGPGLDPEVVVRWISQILAGVEDKRQFLQENSNGERSADVLQRIERGLQDRPSNSDVYLRYASLLDTLVDAGVRLASHLQQKLERRP